MSYWLVFLPSVDDVLLKDKDPLLIIFASSRPDLWPLNKGLLDGQINEWTRMEKQKYFNLPSIKHKV